MPTARINGVNLYYEVYGQGVPIVWSHEFAGDCRSWEPQVNYFSRRYQVVIVGGGPVGVGLALELGLRGKSCAVLERHTGMHNIPKGQNLTGRTIEHFWFWGIADEMRDARLLPPGFSTSGITAYKTLTSDYWYAIEGREAVRQFYFQPNLEGL